MTTTELERPAAMTAEPQQEHQWLQQLVGEWSYEADAMMAPDQPSERFTGSERVRTLNGLWFVAEGQGQMPGGGTATTIMTLGYDPQKKRYLGTWIGSMMTHLWLYDGELDPGAKTLTLNSDGPDMVVAGRMAKYKDVIAIKSQDLRTLTSYQLGADGQWHQIMTATYRRKR